MERVKNAGNRENLTEELAEKITLLWKDPGIQKTYSMQNQFQLNDSAA
jgi:hypothetical protein